MLENHETNTYHLITAHHELKEFHILSPTARINERVNKERKTIKTTIIYGT